MKVSDYMVKFLEAQGVQHVFGIPGVGCSHFMDSMAGSGIMNHVTYHEQGAAFAACGYGQAARKAGFAYTTAGPGGTNLLTGVANAFCDSIPVVFMVGEKDLSSLRGARQLRQKASQEVDIVAIARPVTKWSYQVAHKEEIRFVLEKSFYLAEHGRPGPVLLDIPSDIQRAEVDVETLEPFTPPAAQNQEETARQLKDALEQSERPVFLIGNGVKGLGLEHQLFAVAQAAHIPVVTTLVCFDLAPDSPVNLGFIGMDGDLCANKAVAECDLLISFGARLNFKQVGNKRASFAPQAKIMRVDCDEGELSYRLRDEIPICADLRDLVPVLARQMKGTGLDRSAWLRRCLEEKAVSKRGAAPNPTGNALMEALCRQIPADTLITVDTGSHRRWLMAQHRCKPGQRVLQSAGLASMGYALPAAIGAHYASGKPVVCIDGDGGIMMNLQELQWVARERLPLTVLVFNNHCLGDIMEFQKRIMDKRYFATTEASGYQAADFAGLAAGFHLGYQQLDDFSQMEIFQGSPQLIEVLVSANDE